MSKLGGKKMSEDTDRNTAVASVVAGDRISVDNTDPNNPIVTADVQAGGQVDSVVGGTNCSVDAADPVNPIVNADAAPIQSITMGTNMTNSGTASDPILDAAGGAGEANTNSNSGTGDGKISQTKSGVDLPLKSIKAGTNITVTNNADDITIASTASGSTRTTKGDIEGYDTGDARVPIGTDDQVLTADSSAALGLAWKDAAGGGGASVLNLGDSARITRTTNLTMDGNQVIVFTLEDYDDGDFANVPSVNDRFTIPAGVTRVDIGFHCQTSGISVSNYLKLSIDHLNSGLGTIELFSMHEADTGSTIPGYDCSLPGLEVTPGDVIRFRMLCEDTSYTITKASAFIRDVTPGVGATANVNSFHGALIEEESDVVRNGNLFTVTYDNEAYDTDSFADLGTNNNRLTVPAGVTKVQLSFSMNASNIVVGSDNRQVIAHYNSGDTVLHVYSDSEESANNFILGTVTTPVIVVSAGDYFISQAQSSDSSWTQTYTSFSIEYKDGTLVDPGQNLTTKGDLVAYDTTATRLAVGTDDQVLTADSTAAEGVAWKDAAAGGGANSTALPSGCRVTLTADKTGLGTTLTALTWDSEIYDDDNWHPASNNSRLTVPAGVTRVDVSCSLFFKDVTAGADLYIYLQQFDNGTDNNLIATVAWQHSDAITTASGLSAAAIGVNAVEGNYFVVKIKSSDSSYSIDLTSTMSIKAVNTPVIQAVVGFHGGAAEELSLVGRGSGTYTATYDNELYDTDGFVTISGTTDRVTVPAGVTKVDVTGSIDTGNQGAGATVLRLNHFDSGDSLLAIFGNTMNGDYTTPVMSASTGVIPVSEGDYFQMAISSQDTSWNQERATLGIEYKDGTLVEAVANATKACRVNRTTSMATSTLGVYNVTFDTQDYDDSTFADLGTDDDRLTIPAGVTRVDISSYVRFSQIGDNTRVRIVLTKFNSSDVSQGIVSGFEAQTGGTFNHCNLAAVGVPCVAGDYFTISTSNEDTTTTVTEAHFAIRDVSP